MGDTEREREAETQAQREAGSVEGPHVEVDAGTPGSCPRWKAGTQLLSHPGVPSFMH